MWKLLLLVHARRPIHGLLSLVGPVLLVGGIVTWYFLIVFGWFLVFSSAPESVESTNSGHYAHGWQKFYFVSSTSSTLGYGDLVPTGFPWTLGAGVASFTSTVTLTASLSYVFSVVTAALQRRTFAQGVFGLGRTLPQFIRNAQLGASSGSLEGHVASLTSQLNQYSHNHLCFPVLHYFHSGNPTRSAERAVLLLSDAFFLMHHSAVPEFKPSSGLTDVMESSISNFLELTDTELAVPAQPYDALTKLRSAASDMEPDGLTSHALQEPMATYEARRAKLVALCSQGAWPDGCRGADYARAK